MGFYVGQKVERVSGSTEGAPNKTCPPLYTTTTVSWVGVSTLGNEIIDLCEYPCPETVFYDRGYQAQHFRPVVSRPTSIAIFTAMLTPTKQDA